MSSKYAGNPDAIRALVREDSVHRDVYLSEELFDLETRYLFPNTWIYVGHDSQVPRPGDFYTTEIGRVPVIMVRGEDGSVRVLMNRCAHKGAKVVGAVAGSTGRFFRCPYHAWAFRLDGSILAVPGREGYEGSSFWQGASAHGLPAVKAVENYRGFVFARLAEEGIGFREYFGDSLSSIDNMVDRSPEGRLEVAGGVLRYMHDCNWKMFVENLNDNMHPMVAHESSAGTVRKLWSQQPPDTPKPMVVEQFLPFANDVEFFDRMGVRIFANGHSYGGVNTSIHAAYSMVPEYDAKMVAAYGEERAHAILGEARHNTVYYPSLTIKGAIQAIRVARPISAERTVVESWTFRLVGAPDELLERTVTYTRLINAPTSVVGHDDLTCYRAIQEGLRAPADEWVSLHRYFRASERADIAGVYNGNSEVTMRGQMRAWAKFMTAGMPAGGEA